MITPNAVREPLRSASSFVVDRPHPLPRIDPRSPRYDTVRRLAAQLQHKENLLREVQHRVGNSLQIIASILALDARKAHSEEAQLHLENAHRRLLAVATVQQQLDTSRESGECELAGFLRRLCENLTASVVDDTTRIVIEVDADAGTVSSPFAMNIGLIVTELVINALKHAFVAEAVTGRIVVTYRSQGADWKLTVSDDGIGGLCGEQDVTPAGLGTSIVTSLVRQLDAREKISTGSHGRSVSITHGVFSEMPAAHPALTSFLARRSPGRSPGDSKDVSVFQARWLLVPIFALFVAVAALTMPLAGGP